MGRGRTIRACATAAAVTTAALAVGSGVTHAAADGSGTIISGHARFEVLSPTLIRMEYAGDDKFTDTATFNAIGRDHFAHTDFTSSTADGWLTISTGKATLKYKVGSGPFTAQNVSLSVNGVTAAPAFAPATFDCAAGSLCEAELAQLNGVSVATDHAGFTGTGFAAGFQADGNSLTYTLDVPTAGTYDLQVRYANSTGGDNQNTTRTLSATIDGAPPRTLSLPTTANWDTWAPAKLGDVTLTAGRHTFTLARRPGDSGNVNVDSLALTAAGGSYPSAAPATGAPCVFGTSCEAEDGALAGGAKLATDHGGSTGRGFVAGLENANAKETISLANVPQDGGYTLHLRYANGTGGARTISVDGTVRSLAPTADWETWGAAAGGRS
jgi:hypothetical protein